MNLYGAVWKEEIDEVGDYYTYAVETGWVDSILSSLDCTRHLQV